MKRFCSLLTFLYFINAGCANPIISNAELKVLLAPADTVSIDGLICQDCTTAWQRANLWVANHSLQPIQTSNEWLIQTGYITSGTFAGITLRPYSFTITKEKIAGGNRIKMETQPGYGLPNGGHAKRAFYYYLETGNDLFATPHKEFQSMK
jgi:hypothetical protein